MPFIEDYIKQQQNPPVKEGLDLDVEYRIQQLQVGSPHTKSAVVQRRAGTVFIGTLEECTRYIRQQRAKEAIKQAEKSLATPRRDYRQGANPDFTR
jgi:hypothetical protein